MSRRFACVFRVLRSLEAEMAGDHVVTPQAPWTGSGWREYSYGGFGEAAHFSAFMATTETRP